MENTNVWQSAVESLTTAFDDATEDMIQVMCRVVADVAKMPAPKPELISWIYRERQLLNEMERIAQEIRDALTLPSSDVMPESMLVPEMARPQQYTYDIVAGSHTPGMAWVGHRHNGVDNSGANLERCRPVVTRAEGFGAIEEAQPDVVAVEDAKPALPVRALKPWR